MLTLELVSDDGLLAIFYVRCVLVRPIYSDRFGGVV